MNLITHVNFINIASVCSYNRNSEGVELTNATAHFDEGVRYKFSTQTTENSNDRFIIIGTGNLRRDVPLDDEISIFLIQKEGTEDKYEITGDSFRLNFVTTL